MEAFPKLYTDLTKTPAEKLLCLDTPAFSFISEERFKYSNFPEELLVPARSVLEENKEKAAKVIKILLPKLAEGWERQRGDEYSFGSKPDMKAKDCLSAMDQEKLKSAPINNLDPERLVSAINYERQVKGATQLVAASQAHVVGKDGN